MLPITASGNAWSSSSAMRILTSRIALPTLTKLTRIGVLRLDRPIGIANAQAVAVDGNARILGAGNGQRDADRRFGQSVDRVHRGSFQAMRRECREKLLAQLPGNRLGAVEYQLDAGQVEVGQALALKQLQKMLVAEIRRTQLRGAQLVGLAHPEQRSPDEHAGIHDRMIHADAEHAQVIADQAHVVRQRHPAQALVVLVPAGPLDDGANIGAQVPVRQHDAFRVARRTRRVLDECGVIRRRREHLAMRRRQNIGHERPYAIPAVR